MKHLEDRDRRKLSKMGVKGQKQIIADIYGSNNGVTKELDWPHQMMETILKRNWNH